MISRENYMERVKERGGKGRLDRIVIKRKSIHIPE